MSMIRFLPGPRYGGRTSKPVEIQETSPKILRALQIDTSDGEKVLHDVGKIQAGR